MSQRARAYRRQARTDRYGSAAFAQQQTRPNRVGIGRVYTAGDDWNRCQHCGAAGLDLMETHGELVEAAQHHGQIVLPVPPAPQGAELGGYWFCHRCGEGGPVYKLSA